MEKEHKISIDNGTGTININSGSYNVLATVNGYDDTSILPNSIYITDDNDEYNFTISATGKLTLHVTNGSGLAINGATFYRTDSDGNTYGDSITTDESGNAIFNNVPYSTEADSPTIYYKQTDSDGEHTFNTDVQMIKMTSDTSTIEITNNDATNRTINLTDANYEGLDISTGSISLT